MTVIYKDAIFFYFRHSHQRECGIPSVRQRLLPRTGVTTGMSGVQARLSRVLSSPEWSQRQKCLPSSELRASRVAQLVKNPPVKAGESRAVGLILELRRSDGVGNGNPFQYSCLGNAIDRWAWRAAVHGVAKGWTWLITHCKWTQTQKCLPASELRRLVKGPGLSSPLSGLCREVPISIPSWSWF